MSIFKRIFGAYLNDHHGGSQKSKHGGNRKSHHGQNTFNDVSFKNEAPKIRCGQCQADNELGARFCGQCGQSMGNTVCTCGAKLAADAKFCGQCGKSR